MSLKKLIKFEFIWSKYSIHINIVKYYYNLYFI